MKTKIRTLLAICILGFIGIININAVADNKKTVNTEVGTEKVELLNNEASKLEETFFDSAEALTAKEADQQIEKYATRQIQAKENPAKSDFINSAESYTAAGADQMIEKFSNKLVVNQLIKEAK